MNPGTQPWAYAGPDGPSVQRMFGAIAHRYDLLNHLLSASVDRYWRRQAVAVIGSLAPQAGDRCLDLCTGTGDLALELARRLQLETVGSDFCHPMLLESIKKINRRGLRPRLSVAEADAQSLPFAENSFRFVTVAFGVRNVESLPTALEEMYRVLVPGGSALILEFAKPVIPGFSRMFDFYFSHILPRVGAWVSGVDGPYQYLPASVRRFPSQPRLVSMIESAGFGRVQYRNLTLGIAALHWGTKPTEPSSIYK
jgi:demethylmenaquinone methyltransferase/2-methoxy-6-polyprenyl-1,4-benzoquinol methylase